MQQDDGTISGTDDLQLRRWADRLQEFAREIASIAGASAVEFGGGALGAWQRAVTDDPPLLGTPANLIVLDVTRALAELVGRTASDDSITREQAVEYIFDAVASARGNAVRWLTEGPPSPEEADRRVEAIRAALAETQASVANRIEQSNEPSSPYGALLGYVDPTVDAKIIFTQVCPFDSDEHKRYSTAYERLKRRVDRDLLMYVFDELDTFMVVVERSLRIVNDGNFDWLDPDKADEFCRRLRSGVVTVTSAFHVHQTQTYWLVQDKFGKDSDEHRRLTDLFHGLYDGCAGYQWLLQLRHVMLHISIEAAAIRVSARLDHEPTIEVNMDREWMKESSGVMGKAYNRKPLLAMTEDPSVIGMVKEAMPALAKLQDQIDDVLYPETADDAAIVRELIGRFDGRQGLYALQLGPGFTPALRVLPHRVLAPRVLAYAESFDKSDDSASPES